MIYPIGIQTFRNIIERRMAYVDKTDSVYALTQCHANFLGRPHRFGKSLTLSTFKNYFKGKCELFCGLKMDFMDYCAGSEVLKRISVRGYAESYAADARQVVCVGVGFSSATRNIAEWKHGICKGITVIY